MAPRAGVAVSAVSDDDDSLCASFVASALPPSSSRVGDANPSDDLPGEAPPPALSAVTTGITSGSGTAGCSSRPLLASDPPVAPRICFSSSSAYRNRSASRHQWASSSSASSTRASAASLARRSSVPSAPPDWAGATSSPPHQRALPPAAAAAAAAAVPRRAPPPAPPAPLSPPHGCARASCARRQCSTEARPVRHACPPPRGHHHLLP